MNLINVARNILGLSVKNTDKKQVQIKSDSDVTQDMRQKEKDVYGTDEIGQRKLYEKWAVKSSWHLKNEAIPLLLSIDPDEYSSSSLDEMIEKRHQDLCEHAQHCVEQGLLFVVDKENPIDEWEVKPIDVYKWAAISRVEIPVYLSTLMEFVMMTLLPTEKVSSESPVEKSQSGNSYSSDKEYVLGAALAMLASHPEQCVNKKGRVRAENIISLINKNENQLYGEETPGLSSTVAIDLINKWIEKGS